MKKAVILLPILLCVLYCKGAVTDSLNYPKIGKIVPGFDQIINSTDFIPPKSISNDKPTALIFWAKYCAACIRSFPTYNQAYKKYRNRLNIILIAPGDSVHPRIYNNYKKKMNLDIVSAFDSEMFYNRESKLTPHVFWIDQNGILKAETTKLSDTTIINFLAGDEISNHPTSYRAIQDYDSNALFLIKGNGGSNETDFLFRSLLAEWKEGMGQNGLSIMSHPRYLRNGKVEFLKITITDLYKLAYFGKSKLKKNGGYAIDPILEMSDSKTFFDNKFYCYSLKVPTQKASKKILMRVMQNDLENYFGYKARVERKNYRCLNLSFDDQSNPNQILSIRDTVQFESSPLGLKVNKVKLSEVINHLATNLIENHLIRNRTGLDDSTLIDLELKGTIYHLEDLKQQLKLRYGLVLLAGETQLETLIIKDSH